MDLTDRAALVTGAGGDIGRAIAAALAPGGAAVAAHDRIADELATAEAVRKAGQKAVEVTGDVAEPGAVAAFVDSAAAGLGRLDVVADNAGIMTKTPLLDLSVEEWRRSTEVDLSGCFLVTHAAVPHLVPAGAAPWPTSPRGLPIAACSGSPTTAPRRPRILGFTRAAVRELAPQGIRVNVVVPGPIETAMTAPCATPEWPEAKLAGGLTRRFGRTDEVAATVAFLASDSASLYLGQTRSPNGGGVMP